MSLYSFFRIIDTNSYMYIYVKYGVLFYLYKTYKVILTVGCRNNHDFMYNFIYNNRFCKFKPPMFLLQIFDNKVKIIKNNA